MASSLIQPAHMTIQYSPAPLPRTALALLELPAPNQDSQTQSAPDASANHRFTLFPALPKEVRDMIWKEALPGPRFIKIGWKVWTEELDDGNIIDYCKCLAGNDHPAMLHACHESRQIALKVFQLSLADDLKYPIYYDITRDVLVFHSLQTLCLFIKNGEISNRVGPGRIAVIALDLSRPSLDALKGLGVLGVIEEFFFREPSSAEESKWFLFDNVTVLTTITDVEELADEEIQLAARPITAIRVQDLSDWACHRMREVVADKLQEYFCQMQKALQRVSTDDQIALSRFKRPDIVLATQEGIMNWRSMA